MKGLFTHPQWNMLEEWLEREWNTCISVFVHTDKEDEMFRLQGYMKMILKLKALKEKTLSEEK